MKNPGLYDLTPALCRLDYTMSEAGGGFIGVGEPSGYQYQGRFFQLSDVLGVEKECNFRHFEKRDNIVADSAHWMTEGINLEKISFNDNVRGVDPLSARTLVMHYDEHYPLGWQNAGMSI